MDTADLVNRIISKLGGNRVEFLRIETHQHNRKVFAVCEFVHANNSYEARCAEEGKEITVKQSFYDQGPLVATAFSTWVEGVLNGKVRTEAGNLVHAAGRRC